MNKIIIALLCLSFLPAAYADDSLDLSQQDKQLHVAVSYAIAETGYSVLKANHVKYPFLKAAGLALTAGLIKEATDKQFSRGDLQADGVGILGAGAIILVFQF